MSAETWALTETGKRKAEVAGDVQGLRFDIITYIESHGDSSIAEIADGTNANASEVRIMVRKLEREGWLISSEEADEI
jgi:DNA-binding MarR family transcriptional regulator